MAHHESDGQRQEKGELGKLHPYMTDEEKARSFWSHVKEWLWQRGFWRIAYYPYFLLSTLYIQFLNEQFHLNPEITLTGLIICHLVVIAVLEKRSWEQREWEKWEKELSNEKEG